MEVKINEIINWVHSNYKDKIVQIHIVKSETLEGCFKQMYSFRRSGRYDSARRYEFEDRALESKYRGWKEKNETIEMYYGSATVD